MIFQIQESTAHPIMMRGAFSRFKKIALKNNWHLGLHFRPQIGVSLHISQTSNSDFRGKLLKGESMEACTRTL